MTWQQCGSCFESNQDESKRGMFLAGQRFTGDATACRKAPGRGCGGAGGGDGRTMGWRGAGMAVHASHAVPCRLAPPPSPATLMLLQQLPRLAPVRLAATNASSSVLQLPQRGSSSAAIASTSLICCSFVRPIDHGLYSTERREPSERHSCGAE